MNVSISICPTSLEAGGEGDRYDEAALVAAIRQYVEERHPRAAVTVQVGHRQGDEWARIDGDEEAGAALLLEFWEDHASDEELFVAPPAPVMVEVASCDETIRRYGGIEDFAGLEHPAISDACEAYHRAATDSLMRSGGRLNWCVPRGQRRLHSVWAGAHFACSYGAIGTMATDLTEAEKAAISAADDAGREAARMVIAEADAVA